MNSTGTADHQAERRKFMASEMLAGEQVRLLRRVRGRDRRERVDQAADRAEQAGSVARFANVAR